ncbi:insecticidal delta-endotoxin Cry8Ea1 family protein, partial [Bacillus thuringiensis]
PNYEVIGVPYLVQITTLELVVLRDTIQAGEKWGYSNLDQKNQLEDLRKLITKRTNLVYQAFQKGLNDVYGAAQKTNNYKDWNEFYQYISDSTTLYLDIVAMWPTFDPITYSMESDIDLTRTIISPIIHAFPSDPYSFHVNLVDQIALNNYSPRYVGDLSQIQLSQYSGNQYEDYVNGVKQTFQNSNNSPITFSADGSQYTVDPIDVSNTNPVIATSLTNKLYNKIRAASFTATFLDGTSKEIDFVPWLAASGKVYYAYQKAPDDHKIAYIIPMSSYIYTDYVNVYSPLTTFAANIIGNPDSITNKVPIRGISAEKYSSVSGPGSFYVEPEWINGSKSLRISPQGTVTYNVTNITKQKYQVRIRYATNGNADTSFWIDIFNDIFNLNQKNYDLINKTFTFPAPTEDQMLYQGRNGKYVLQTLGDPIELPSGKQVIEIINMGSQDLILDRIEFVPVIDFNENIKLDLQTFHFTTPEDLEKITNQVNQLFTSSSQTELVETVTDYEIDQVVMKVDGLSDDVFGVEKKALRRLVNQAKQISKARN